MVQVIICKCGSKVAACTEPECYTEKDWQKDVRWYATHGYTIEMQKEAVALDFCKCKEMETKNQLTLPL